MYNEQIEALISAALADGMLTEKEKQILFKKAQSQGIDLDEFEMVLDARLVELEKAEKAKAAAAAAPKSTKYGDVRKCPSCGAMVPSLAGVCPECGYEFSGIEANPSSRQLADMLLTAEKELAEEERIEMNKTPSRTNISLTSIIDGGESDRIRYQQALQIKYKRLLKQRQRTIIETFPIPNTKVDLFEFIVSMEPKITGNKLASSYRKKINECLNKALMLYPNDSIFIKLNQKVQEHLKRRFKIALFITLGVVILTSFLLSYLLLHPARPDRNAKVCIEMVQDAILDGNLDDALTLVNSYKKSPHKIYVAYETLLNEYLKNDNAGQVKYLIRNYKSRTKESAPKSHDEQFYNYLINAGEYNEAEKYLVLPESSFWEGNKERNEAYMNHLSKCVSQMCARKQKKAAYKFINEKVAFYQGEDRKLYDGKQNPWYPENVKTRLNKIVNSN